MADYEQQGRLHDMFVRQAQRSPNKVAVVGADDSRLTFKELDERSEVVAHHLRSLGVREDSIVGIYMERSIDYVIAYISILRAGGAYMPIDASYPPTLIEEILADAKPVAVCVQEDMKTSFPESRNVVIFNEHLYEEIRRNCEVTCLNDDATKIDSLAYTVYSSGTTGKPKGIQCPHRGAVFSYHWRHSLFPYSDDEREACNVFFTWEMLRPLIKGVELHVISDSVIYDPKLLCEFVQRRTITRMLFTPSLLETVLDAQGENITSMFASLKTIIFCGEVVTVGLLTRCINALPNTRFVNLYSISEAHDVASCDLTAWFHQQKGDLGSKKFCPVGKLLPGVQVVILDSKLTPQPVGVPGEIYIGGPTLARGYLNRPELNKQRFIARPEGVAASAGERLYKAGDWGYSLSDGSFEICGRCDSMVKVRGYSIETQAVEAALLELPMVFACVVLVLGEEGEDKYLVAYVVPKNIYVTKKEIRAALKKRLPFYMIPSYFSLLSAIPILTSSGKLDKKALPPIDKQEAVDKEGQPSTNTERKLVLLWAEVLQLENVDVQESFFDLGGHSLLATKLLGTILQEFNIELKVKDLFTYSTIASMAKLLDAKMEGSSDVIDAADVSLDLRKELERHDQEGVSLDISLRAFWRSMQYSDRWKDARVLLTGATGFLGSFILREFLLKTECRLYCLVRALPDQDVFERLKQSCRRFRIFENPSTEELFDSRVTAIQGDVALVNLGLEEDDYTYLSTDVDIVVHAAAAVNLIYPYQAVHGANVLGTQNVLMFSCARKIKPLHYISTDAVFPHGLTEADEDEDMAKFADQLTDGYSQSKWVAEQLVLKAMTRGLPAAVYRLGNQAGDTVTSAWNPHDFTLLVVQGCLLSGFAPTVEWKVELTPVDFAASFVVTLTQKMALALGKTFNVVNTNTVTSLWLFEWISAHGYPLKMVSFQEWKQKINELDSSKREVDLLQKVLDSMIRDESYFSQLTSYKNDNVYKVLSTLEMQYPEVDSHLLAQYFKGLRKNQVIPKISQNVNANKELSGKVAVVTGASSGIGLAIAKQLASRGAKVAMVARREELLQAGRAEIESEGGVAITVKCDVTSKSMVKDMVARVTSTLGDVDILVNNAGVMYYTMMKNLKEEEWERTIDINCKGVTNCIGAVLGGMVERKSGHIVNMSSDAGRRGFAGLAVYSGTKFFVEGLSQGMRHELAPIGVRVTCIQPGDVKTELFKHTTDLEAKEAYDGSGNAHILEPDDVARAVAYAVTQPPFVAINEILIEPREAPI